MVCIWCYLIKAISGYLGRALYSTHVVAVSNSGRLEIIRFAYCAATEVLSDYDKRKAMYMNSHGSPIYR